MIKKSFPIKKAVAKEKWEPPKKLDGFRGTLVVDPKHPDGIKLTNEHDMYDLYKDDPVRYVEEVKYLFEDGDPPKDRIKKFDGHDSSTFPYNQKKELDIYQKKINNLSPQQKKQLEWNQKKAELAAKVKARVRAHYSKAWGVELDPKKMKNQDKKLADLPIIKGNINYQKIPNQDLKSKMREWISEADSEKKKVAYGVKPNGFDPNPNVIPIGPIPHEKPWYEDIKKLRAESKEAEDKFKMVLVEGALDKLKDTGIETILIPESTAVSSEPLNLDQILNISRNISRIPPKERSLVKARLIASIPKARI